MRGVDDQTIRHLDLDLYVCVCKQKIMKFLLSFLINFVVKIVVTRCFFMTHTKIFSNQMMKFKYFTSGKKISFVHLTIIFFVKIKRSFKKITLILLFFLRLSFKFIHLLAHFFFPFHIIFLVFFISKEKFFCFLNFIISFNIIYLM